MARRPYGEEIDCQWCNQKTRNLVYCSRTCQTQAYRQRELQLGNRISLVCQFCKVEFYVHKSDLQIHPNKRYCSRRCKDVHQTNLYKGQGNPLAGRITVPKNMVQKKQMSMFNSAKSRSEKSGIPFNITKDDIIIPDRCPLLDIPLFTGSITACANSPSLDRIDPTKGYIKGNIHVISYKANTIKQDATLDELTMLLSNLTDIWQKLNSNE